MLLDGGHDDTSTVIGQWRACAANGRHEPDFGIEKELRRIGDLLPVGTLVEFTDLGWLVYETTRKNRQGVRVNRWTFSRNLPDQYQNSHRNPCSESDVRPERAVKSRANRDFTLLMALSNSHSIHINQGLE